MQTPQVSRRQIVSVMWIAGLLVVGLAVLAWYGLRFSASQGLTSYLLFPLLGLLAFSLMWTHYVGGALRRYFGFDKSVLSRYFKVTSGIILILLLLHPGILWFQLAQDGFGLPPLSHLAVYVDAIARLALLLGTISLILFLAFELHRKYGDRSWWKYINYGNIIAMFAIFVHALILGGELKTLWFQMVWYFYGITLVFAAIYTLNYDRKRVGGKYEK